MARIRPRIDCLEPEGGGRPVRHRGRRRPWGEIAKAIKTVLGSGDQLRGCDIHAAVEALLGQAVSPSSVNDSAGGGIAFAVPGIWPGVVQVEGERQAANRLSAIAAAQLEDIDEALEAPPRRSGWGESPVSAGRHSRARGRPDRVERFTAIWCLGEGGPSLSDAHGDDRAWRRAGSPASPARRAQPSKSIAAPS